MEGNKVQDKLDYKKKYRDIYQPKTTPSVIEIPEMVFITVEGRGNPNTCKAYANAMEVLYGLSYGIKMSKMDGSQPEGYFEYVVPPLEGCWWFAEGDFDGKNIWDKDRFLWLSMIRQPEFVTQKVFEHAKEVLLKKKPGLDLSSARLEKITEGLCVQCMHVGTYDKEPETIDKMEQFIETSGYATDINDKRHHHEIYLGDPRKTAPERLRTIIRHPIKVKK